MNNVTSFFDKKKRELSNNSNDKQDTKNQRKASSMELSFEKASDGDVFKFPKIWGLYFDIEKMYEKYWKENVATKSTKESQIKKELQLVSMNKTINFISEKFDEFEKNRREKDEIIKNLSKETSKMAQRIDKLDNLVDLHEKYSWCNSLLLHGNAETNDENMDSLVLKTINKKLDVDTVENEIDRSHRIGRKNDGQRPRPIVVTSTRYNTRKRVFASKRKLKRTSVSITESLTVKRMKQLNKAREEHGFTNIWTTDDRMLFKRPNENKSNLFYD